MNKFDRVISTLIALQSKPLTKARELTDRFGVSLRTIYRDIATLKTAGIPIVGDPGIGYSIVEGYKMPPISFSEEEASALLTAEKFIGKLTDKTTEQYYSNALLKIKAILRGAEKQSIHLLDQSIANTQSSSIEDSNHLSKIFKAITTKTILSIKYQKADNTITQRDIDPIGCFHQGRKWYLAAYCHDRQDYRTFKVERIVDLYPTDRHFDRHHMSLQQYIDKTMSEWSKDNELLTFVISFRHSLIQYAELSKFYFGFVDQVEGQRETTMTFLNASVEYMARWLVQFGDQVDVISPIALVDRLKALTKELQEHYF